ncbi:MAG: NERD domain-containing protein [Clostridia bacterium]|nr:NERD domain-containing protein [Clostridia bacterium]
MKKTEDYIREMEESNILMTNEVTFQEYANELLKFQDLVCKMVARDKYHEQMRIEEALKIIENISLEKEMRNHPAVHKGIVTMSALSKEIAITMSGAKGEKSVSKTLEYLNRPNTKVFRNIYVEDDQEKSELDAVILTDSGIIILEVKKVKSSITLTEDGKMVLGEEGCYDRIPLGEKMAIKRKLLKNTLENIVSSAGLDIPIYVDSYIVFSTPKGQYIKMEDRYHKEKYCFRIALNQKIENYVSNTHYTDEQLKQLDGILSEMAANLKRFHTDLNFDDVRHSLAEAMYVLQNETKEVTVEETIKETTEPKQKVIKNSLVNEKAKTKSKKLNGSNGLEYIAVGAIASIVGIALLLKSSPKRA